MAFNSLSNIFWLRGRWGGGTGISSDGDDRMGAKRKIQKNPRTENLWTPKQSHAAFLKFSLNINH